MPGVWRARSCWSVFGPTSSEASEDDLNAPVELELDERIIEPQVAEATEHCVPIANAITMLAHRTVVKLTAVDLNNEPVVDEQVHQSHPVDCCLRLDAQSGGHAG